MPTHSIDYLNARRARLAASGGTNYAARLVRRSGEAAKGDAEMDAGELLHEQVRLVFADFRAWFAESTNALRSGNIADDGAAIPF
jgi:hypothetical protein